MHRAEDIFVDVVYLFILLGLFLFHCFNAFRTHAQRFTLFLSKCGCVQDTLHTRLLFALTWRCKSVM